jgi:hypothetical protein
VAFQPASDLAPCTVYRAEITPALVDAAGRPVAPAAWQFRTSGCRGHGNQPVRGTVTCGATALATADADASGIALASLAACVGGQDGRAHRAQLPIASGAAVLRLRYAQGGCAAFAAGGAVTVTGDVRWTDAAGRYLGTSHIAPQPYDLRGTQLTVDRRSDTLPGQVLALRIAVDPTPCVTTPGRAVITSNHARATSWVPGE